MDGMWISSQIGEDIDFKDVYVDLQSMHIAYYQFNRTLHFARAIYHDSNPQNQDYQYTQANNYKYVSTLCKSRPSYLPSLPIPIALENKKRLHGERSERRGE